MGCFDDGNYNDVESFLCECGGNVIWTDGNHWECDQCDYRPDTFK